MLSCVFGMNFHNLPVWPDDFKWSSAGKPDGYECLKIGETRDHDSWDDNYLCWRDDKTDPKLFWSTDGIISKWRGGHRCTKITVSDPDSWDDNYLCEDDKSPYRFSWSEHGPIFGNRCIRWTEPADPQWNNGLLCSFYGRVYINLDMPYNDYTWLTSHNAYASPKYTEWGPNQWFSMYDQMMTFGVRGLMIDLRPKDGDVWFAHEGDYAGKYTERMQAEVAAFLQKNQEAVLWIDIQAHDDLTADQFESAMANIPDITAQMFNPKDELWANHTQWPTVRQLINSGQRIIMVSKGPIVKTYTTFTVLSRIKLTAENDWAVVDKNSCDQRYDSIGYNSKYMSINGYEWPRLFMMNHFRVWSSDWRWEVASDNSWDGLYPRVLFCKDSAGLDSYPNFLAVDFVNKGNVREVAEVLTDGGFVFYSANRVEGDVVCGIGAGRMHRVGRGEMGCENDEARSVLLVSVNPETRLEVYDSPFGETDDDYSILTTKSEPVSRHEVWSFAENRDNNWITLNYHSHNGLDGKISLFVVTPNIDYIAAESDHSERRSFLVQESITTNAPTESPTNQPTEYPSVSPTNLPSVSPTNDPTFSPTESPTYPPTVYPTVLPTNLPSLSPTNEPTFSPTRHPTFRPSPRPSPNPTKHPTPAGVGGPNDWSYCTSNRKCSLGQGDCDSDNDCAAGMTCGQDNCRSFHPTASPAADCCYDKPGIGASDDWSYCSSSSRQCSVGQGDCDKNSDCAVGLLCGKDNCQQFHPNAEKSSDCCYDGSGTALSLYRYYNHGIVDHFYTTNWSELGGGRSGWKYEGVQCKIYKSQVSGTVALYRYWGNNDHFYTTNLNEIGTGTNGKVGRHGYKSEGVAGYCYPKRVSSSVVPLYRFWNSQYSDHFYTTSKSEGTRASLKYEGVACYVLKK